MTPSTPLQPGRWNDGELPLNVVLGVNTVINGSLAFKRFHSEADRITTVGEHCFIDGVHFSTGKRGRIVIGNYCCFTNVVLLSELEVVIGNYVVIGWNTTIADTDFHPLDPAERILDAIACSPLGKGQPRPKTLTSAVTIEDDVWIGANVTILKGVRIGAGAFIEPGSLVTRNVPAGVRVMGNPAQIIEEPLA